MRIKTSCVRSSAPSAFDVNRYARLKMRRENAVTISSQATPSPDRARRTSSAPLISADAFKASKLSSPNGLALTFPGNKALKPALSKLVYDTKEAEVPTKIRDVGRNLDTQEIAFSRTRAVSQVCDPVLGAAERIAHPAPRFFEPFFAGATGRHTCYSLLNAHPAIGFRYRS